MNFLPVSSEVCIKPVCAEMITLSAHPKDGLGIKIFLRLPTTEARRESQDKCHIEAGQQNSKQSIYFVNLRIRITRPAVTPGVASSAKPYNVNLTFFRIMYR
jgi:hypothetical protein